MGMENLGTKYDLMAWTVTIDCADAASLAAWWGDLLGVEVHDSGGDFYVLRPQEGGRSNLAFQQVPEPKTVKNRVHVDFVVRDLEGVTERVTGDGGALLSEQEAGAYRWNVLADPEGNEFCVVRVVE